MSVDFTNSDILNMDRIERLKLINSIAGIRNVNLIASKSKNNISNLSIFSSVTHIGSNPALMSFISRPSNEVKRDTMNNIKEHPYFTINSVEKNKLKNAHLTSGKYHSDLSEFKICGFKESYIGDFPVPFVLSSRVKIGLKVTETINIKSNDTILVIGRIEQLNICKDYLIKSKDDNIGVIGLNTYYGITKKAEFEYVRVDENKSS